MPNINPPTKLYACLELAMKDVRKVQALMDKGGTDLVWNMWDWMAIDIELSPGCNMCMAGAVMHQTFNRTGDLAPEDFEPEWTLVFQAIDSLRVGAVCEADGFMGSNGTLTNLVLAEDWFSERQGLREEERDDLPSKYLSWDDYDEFAAFLRELDL